MSDFHLYGAPISIMGFNDDEIVIDEEPLRKMLEHEHVRNRTIVVFSIIGAFRKGKSFFLDYSLRFLYAHYPSINYPDNPTPNPEKWIGDEFDPLSGFSWRSGAERDTTGVIVWSDVFLHTDKTGENIAIIVMDTQGLFDNNTSKANNSRIFALGTLISSVQVLNLSGQIQEDHLEYLQFATEFTKCVTESKDKAFQNLMFLIRDWQSSDDFEFGIEGGEKYLETILKIKDNHPEELKSVRKFIRNSFENVSCALLPNPGKIVTGVKKDLKPYNGHWHGMDEDFRMPFFHLIEYLLKPERLFPKKMNGVNFKAIEFLHYAHQFLEYIQSKDIKAQTAYELYVENQLGIVIDKCITKYKDEVGLRKDEDTTIDKIPLIHYAAKTGALLMFETSKKMGNDDHKEKFAKLLVEKIESIYCEWKEQLEASIKKIEEEKERTRIAEEQKQKAELEKLEIEEKNKTMNLKMEKLKYEKDLEHERLLRQTEIERAKLEGEQKVMVLEKNLEKEKFVMQIEADREKYEKANEITVLKMEHEAEKLMLEKDMQHEKIKQEIENQRQADIHNKNVEIKKIEMHADLELKKLEQQKAKNEMDQNVELQRIAATAAAEEKKIEAEKARIHAENIEKDRIYKEQIAEKERLEKIELKKIEVQKEIEYENIRLKREKDAEDIRVERERIAATAAAEEKKIEAEMARIHAENKERDRLYKDQIAEKERSEKIELKRIEAQKELDYENIKLQKEKHAENLRIERDRIAAEKVKAEMEMARIEAENKERDRLHREKQAESERKLKAELKNIELEQEKLKQKREKDEEEIKLRRAEMEAKEAAEKIKAEAELKKAEFNASIERERLEHEKKGFFSKFFGF